MDAQKCSDLKEEDYTASVLANLSAKYRARRAQKRRVSEMDEEQVFRDFMDKTLRHELHRAVRLGHDALVVLVPLKIQVAIVNQLRLRGFEVEPRNASIQIKWK